MLFRSGDPQLGASFEALRADILRRKREPGALRAEIASMRQTMLDAHPNNSGRFDLKHDRGGIIDVEFIVQYLVLGHAHAHAELTGNIGNLALLKLAARLGLIEQEIAGAVHDAYRRFRQTQHKLRLQGDRYARVDAGAFSAEIQAVTELWNAVVGATTAGEKTAQ